MFGWNIFFLLSHSRMDDSIWTDLCKQPTQPVSTEKYTKLVYNSTTRLHQPVQSILSALDQRANALTKLANFESALRDANVMQQLSPSSALGYIRAATIYSEQGKQRQVIEICNQGLSMVDTMDTHYATLQRAKMDAEERQNTRIDLMSQLPLDIITTALVPMFMDRYLRWDRPCPYLYVCKLWRDRIFQCFNGPEFDMVYQGDDLSKVRLFAPYIKKLEVDEYSEGTWLGDLLHNNDFCSLKELEIGEVSSNCVNHLVSSLKSVSNTLTHFTIEDDGETTLPIEDILVNCSNLVSLEISLTYSPSISSLPTTTWPKITTFNIFTTARAMITCDEIRAIGKGFPSLKKLEFSQCEDMETTRIVMDYYPWMSNLRLSKVGAGCYIVFNDDGHRCNEVGITRLDVTVHPGVHDPWENVTYILRQHHTTLEFISYNANVPNEPEEIYSIKYVRLKKLRLCKSGWWIPHNAPILEELQITWPALASDSTMPDTTPLPPTLKKLELIVYPPLDAATEGPLVRYIQRYAYHSQLKELVIAFHNSTHIANVLDAILCLHQLERLRINCTGDWDSPQMEGFLEGLVKGCQNLTYLGIRCRNAPSTYPINALKRLEHLDELELSVKNLDGDDGFWHAIQTFSQLKCIHIHIANARNMGCLRHLQEQRPDLKIVVHKGFTYP
ncbi:predicted protein [Lichtheimia corymbifera JMRC:FSU:9682]|uniref:Uncharacterized protein n=1 Tax=Lichtheimia corymbifera JMRC:FSU:9682 TaxID=1263082 RepID=A0A068S8T1_9FUNG|nr:predicted protein [Lichtheimia corymbifera JMRC:FSU:9682]